MSKVPQAQQIILTLPLIPLKFTLICLFSLQFLQDPHNLFLLFSVLPYTFPIPISQFLPPLPHLLSFNYAHPKALRNKISNSNSMIFSSSTEQALPGEDAGWGTGKGT